MKYVIKKEDAEKCLNFAEASRGSTWDYSSNAEKNKDSNRIIEIYIGKLGEMGFKYFLESVGIVPNCPEMFKIYEQKEKRDYTDFVMPNGKKIDVKSTRGWGIGGNPKHLNDQHYYVGVKVEINEDDLLDCPIVEIKGYNTPDGPWTIKTSKYGDDYMYLHFSFMYDINDLLNKWEIR